MAIIKSQQKMGKVAGQRADQSRRSRSGKHPELDDVKPRQVSSVIRALDVLSDPWSFLVLREAFFGVRRFDDLQRNLKIARNVLSVRLTRLVSEGLLERRLYVARPPRYEYRLTDQGRDFFPPIVGLMMWGDRWRPSRSGPPLELNHKDCGKPLAPRVVCGSCKNTLSPFDVEFESGPGVGTETDFHAPTTRRRGGDQTWLRGRPCSVARTLKVIGDRWSPQNSSRMFRRREEIQRVSVQPRDSAEYSERPPQSPLQRKDTGAPTISEPAAALRIHPSARWL